MPSEQAGSSGEPAPSGSSAAGCTSPTVEVTSASELQDALSAAGPGTVIALADGVYEGEFEGRGSGSPDAPIALCGGPEAILDGGAIDGGYVFHLENASWWVLSGFTVRNGQKGVMADRVTNTEISSLTVTGIGDEAIHLRRFSTDNLVTGNSISDTGLRRPKFGEGIYIGTAESNWCDISECEPDRSDGNTITDNIISSTTAESIDVKEGTTGGLIRGNSFDGAALEGDADSWVDIKGNDWVIEANTGRRSNGDGFQTHEILDGWGTRNLFRGNTATVEGPGFGFSLTPERDNVVECGNTASSAGEGLTNVDCVD